MSPSPIRAEYQRSTTDSSGGEHGQSGDDQRQGDDHLLVARA